MRRLPHLTDDQYQQLTAEIVERVAVHAPEWTDFRDSDPGVTLAELIGLLAEPLLDQRRASPRARARLEDVVTRLQRAQPSPPSEDPPTRVRYAYGMVLSAEDFTQEQEYHRRKQRRHNQHLHGTGTVRGLEVTVDGDTAAESSVTVSAGVAIAPDGEVLVVGEPLTQPLPTHAAALYVALTLVDRPTAFVPAPGDGDDDDEKHASRIEEVVELHLLAEVTSAHHAVARVELADDRWRVDPTFEPPRVGR